MEVDILIKWTKGILKHGIVTKEFLEEYCILLENSLYGNLEAAILWLRLLNSIELMNETSKEARQTTDFSIRNIAMGVGTCYLSSYRLCIHGR